MKMAEFSIRIYCPWCEASFVKRATAANKDRAKESLIGRTVDCPNCLRTFKIEDYNIVSVYPAPKEVIPKVPYPLMPEEEAVRATWLLGAEIVGEKPLPPGAKPVGTPRFVGAEKTDSYVNLVYEREVKSEKYPEHAFDMRYSRPIFKLMYDRARSWAKTVPREAIKYLLKFEGGLTTRMLSDILGLDYTRVSRHIDELMKRNEVLEMRKTFRRQKLYKSTEEIEFDDFVNELEHLMSVYKTDLTGKPIKPAEVPSREKIKEKIIDQSKLKQKSFLEYIHGED